MALDKASINNSLNYSLFRMNLALLNKLKVKFLIRIV